MLDHNYIKNTYPQPEGTVYLNTPSSGLLSKKSIESVRQFYADFFTDGSKKAESFMFDEIPKIREIVGKFIDAPVDEIALIPNFSFGLSAALSSMRKLKRVLLFRDDYPSLTLPFLLNEYDVYWIDSHDGFSVDVNELKQSILQNKIEILALSHVQYLTGYTINIDDLVAFCKQHGVLFILDGTQSLGAIPFSFKDSGIDIYISSNYKWMNAGFGTGIMCVKDDILKKYPPKMGGYNSYKILEGKWQYKPSIHSYEPGHMNLPGLAMLQKAIVDKLELGVENIEQHNFSLLTKAVEALCSIPKLIFGPPDTNNRSNILVIKGNERFANYLADSGFAVKMRNNIIRIGIHFYNTIDNIQQLTKSILAYQEK